MSINPRIDRSTPVIVQGITGRAGQLHSRLMMDYGTRVVGGVSPGTKVREVSGVPVFAECRQAVAATGATASVLFVGAMQLLGAMREALDAGIRYLVTPTEGMPVHDAIRARESVRASGAIWIGASSPGMAVAGETKLGFLPDDSLKPGRLGLMSKSGTLSYEAGYRLAQKGVGTSVWVGVGGDPVKGTRFADLVPFYAADAGTEGVLIIGEIGGSEEEEFAAALTAQRFAKPVFALIAGRSAPEGVTMGHAGALVHGAHGTFATKRTALDTAGAEVFGSLTAMVAGISSRLN
ncbi:MAG: succinate--CoA ligase subunit alpha [Betaproteobacteria bacterium]|nr:succinate--CoA ligase subunit alpha [Betaproteobacteria bacterium]MDH3438057.1 succinate--CoA ligase subunit alpha [Betaproteobacteria bacterium]